MTDGSIICFQLNLNKINSLKLSSDIPNSIIIKLKFENGEINENSFDEDSSSSYLFYSLYKNEIEFLGADFREEDFKSEYESIKKSMTQLYSKLNNEDCHEKPAEVKTEIDKSMVRADGNYFSFAGFYLSSCETNNKGEVYNHNGKHFSEQALLSKRHLRS